MAKFERRKKRIKSRRVFLIITEGYIEKIYFKQCNRDIDKLNDEVYINSDTAGHTTDPEGIVNYAIKKIKTSKDRKIFEKVFCVFDTDKVESTPRNIENFQKAKMLAKENNFELITSFPCFELWLLLHFDYYDKPGIQCGAVLEQLQYFLPSYPKDKNKTGFEKINFFNRYFNELNDALNRAVKLISKNGLSLSYPNTNIYKIFEQIKQ